MVLKVVISADRFNIDIQCGRTFTICIRAGNTGNLIGELRPRLGSFDCMECGVDMVDQFSWLVQLTGGRSGLIRYHIVDKVCDVIQIFRQDFGYIDIFGIMGWRLHSGTERQADEMNLLQSPPPV